MSATPAASGPVPPPMVRRPTSGRRSRGESARQSGLPRSAGSGASGEASDEEFFDAQPLTEPTPVADSTSGGVSAGGGAAGGTGVGETLAGGATAGHMRSASTPVGPMFAPPPLPGGPAMHIRAASDGGALGGRGDEAPSLRRSPAPPTRVSPTTAGPAPAPATYRGRDGSVPSSGGAGESPPVLVATNGGGGGGSGGGPSASPPRDAAEAAADEKSPRVEDGGLPRAMQVIDKDTGKVYSLFEVGDTFGQRYATFDKYLGIGQNVEGEGRHRAGSDSSGSAGHADGAKKAAGDGSGAAGLFGMFGRKKSDVPVDDGSIKVIVHNKDTQELTRVMLLQEIKTGTDPIWAVRFSMDGTYVAVAGQDAVVRVWRVLPGSASPTPLPNSGRPPPAAGAADGSDSTGASVTGGAGAAKGAAAVAGTAEAAAAGALPLSPSVTNGEGGSVLIDAGSLIELRGHKAHVVDLSWSKSGYLLSASMDNYVRLWDVKDPSGKCQREYQHPDCVTSVAFHPVDDNYILSGCFDQKVRIWNTWTGRVVLWQSANMMITAVAFSPDGQMAVVGLYDGRCIFYGTDGLRYHTQIECRNHKGPLRKGKKVTGIDFVTLKGTRRLLVTTCDSRVRLYSLDDYSPSFKYKGCINNNMQIRASCSSGAEHVICGSEDGSAYVWRTENDQFKPTFTTRIAGLRRNKNNSFESFKVCEGAIATVAMFAPASAIVLARPECASVPHERLPMIFIVGTTAGDLRVFENTGAPVKL